MSELYHINDVCSLALQSDNAKVKSARASVRAHWPARYYETDATVSRRLHSDRRSRVGLIQPVAQLRAGLPVQQLHDQRVVAGCAL